MKQYMPKKPVKHGFKVWMLADSHNGYVLSFEVHTGKKGNTVERGLGASVVKTLCQPIQHRYLCYNTSNSHLINFIMVVFLIGTITSTSTTSPV